MPVFEKYTNYCSLKMNNKMMTADGIGTGDFAYVT